MRVFLGWSGDRSKAIAGKIGGLVETLLPGTTVFFSPADIEKGSRWRGAVAQELQDSEVGIWCLTRRSLRSQWIAFEAGAISKAAESSRPCTLLFGISPKELQSPLSDFHTTEFNSDDVWRLVKALHKLARRAAPTDQGRTRRQFDSLWHSLKKEVAAILAAPSEDDTPLERVQGHWWEKVQPDNSTAISYVTICPDPALEAPHLSGIGYGRRGQKVTGWWSRGACLGPHPEGLILFYYWQGSHWKDKPGTPYVGSGELTFSGSAARLDQGRGGFTDTPLLKLSRTVIKQVEMRRATTEEQRTMSKDSAAKTALIRRKLHEPW